MGKFVDGMYKQDLQRFRSWTQKRNWLLLESGMFPPADTHAIASV